MAMASLEKFFAENMKSGMTDLLLPWADKVMEFTQRVTKSSCKGVALVTSGGTSVPLEVNAVRSVVNFSSGGRGAGIVESLVERNWACIYLHHKTSARPFMQYINQMSSEDFFAEISAPKQSPGLSAMIHAYEIYGDFVLQVPFDTVVEYLFLLCLITQTLSDPLLQHLTSVPMLIIAAAAVSDYYIPLHKMAKEKMSGDDGLIIHFEKVPKILGEISKEWHSSSSTAPRHMITFKLETVEEVMKKKAVINLHMYNCDIVVANMLQNYKEKVLVYVKEEEQRPVLIVRPAGGSLEFLMVDFFLKHLEKEMKYIKT